MENELIILDRVRIDIGNVSGSLSKLLSYSFLKGFDDNYQPQEKPRLVGTWTVNDWYTQEQLVQAQNTFDGLTIVENQNYLLDFSQIAVQVLDDTQPNYNPALAILLQAAGYGNGRRLHSRHRLRSAPQLQGGKPQGTDRLRPLRNLSEENEQPPPCLGGGCVCLSYFPHSHVSTFSRRGAL